MSQETLSNSRSRTAEHWANFILGLNIIVWGILGLVESRWTPVRSCVSVLQFTAGALVCFRKPVIQPSGIADLLASMPSLICCGVVFRLSHPLENWPWLAECMFASGTGLTIVSLVTLGRNIAVFPSARGVTRKGVYKIVRHPVYTGELLMASSCIVAKPSGWILFAVALLLPMVVLRIRAEETLLRSAVNYETYAFATRWRLIPGIW